MRRQWSHGIFGWIGFLALVTIQSAEARVIRASQAGGLQGAFDQANTGDVIINDASGVVTVNRPKKGIQVVGGEATWQVQAGALLEDLVLFNHTAKFLQTGGQIRRLISNSGCKGSRFTHIDSVFFINKGMNSKQSGSIEIRGFLRSATFLFTAFTGSSYQSLSADMVVHNSMILIDATDPVGNGQGTFISNFVAHNATDWNPVQIMNGRGIYLSHFNYEYSEWGDPAVIMNNCVECGIIGMTLGGAGNRRDTPMQDGTVGLGKYLAHRYGAYRITGQNNFFLGGSNYVNLRVSANGQPWAGVIARDPYLSKWSQTGSSSGINLSESKRAFTFGRIDQPEWNGMGETSLKKGAVISSLAQCTTVFMSEDGNKTPSVNVQGLKPGSLPRGPRIHGIYTPMMPNINLDTDGPGTNLTGRSQDEILAVSGPRAVVYLGPGVYQFNKTLTGANIIGAGMGKTILKFPETVQFATAGAITLNNLTIEGGQYGYAQTIPGPNIGLRASNVQFKDQALIGMTVGNIQNLHFQFLHFEGAEWSSFVQCREGIPCGEKNKGTSMIDKINFYGCSFKRMRKGVSPNIDNNGFTSFIGCHFEDITEVGLHLRHSGGKNRKSEGHYVANCTFKNCATAIDIRRSSWIHNVNIVGSGDCIGIKGKFGTVASSSIQGCATAIDVGDNPYVAITDVQATGAINPAADTWISRSSFSGISANQAFIGSVDVTQFLAPEFVPDVTAPSAPGGVQVQSSGGGQKISWQASSDGESGINAYIIERQGQEVHRTPIVYSAKHHLLKESWPDKNNLGIGLYRHPPLEWTDPEGGSYQAGDYKVVAVNGALIRSDGTMAQIRPTAHMSQPQFLIENGRLTSPTVTVGYAPLKPSGKFAAGSMFDVATIPAVNHSGTISISNRKPIRSPGTGPTSLLPANQVFRVYGIQGDLVATLRTQGVARSPESLAQQKGLPPGIYRIPALGRSFVITH